jgi:gluconolactonase
LIHKKSLLIVFLVFIIFVNIFAQSPIPASAKLETLRTGFLQPEGPVWVDSLGILFSDIQGNKIYRWSPVDSTLTPYLNPSDSSNGLTLDLQGRLILTQMAKRRIARREPDGTVTPLAETYNGKKFNSPNDVVVKKSDGSIFFTDPDYNTPIHQNKEMGFKGVFRISSLGTVKALDSLTFKNSEPNGICFSPDESKLYVNDSQNGIIYVWDVANDSTITNKKILCQIPTKGSDGMKIDTAGNLYCTGPTGVWIFSPAGSSLGKITVPGSPSNCAWGDADRKTLFITGGSSLYRIRLTAATSVKDQGSSPSKTFKLMDNYPNPFNPSTIIECQTTKYELLTLKVFDGLGREVAMLVNEFKYPGTHIIEWNASGMPSGTYFCQLRSGNEQQTKKLVFIK